ncbi:unnamed protein product [Cuscuta europaea]|uniref:Uncharacterized protein n=1 Tax=Cuscuta europaea TaxID=41803 RepID=A0A9P1EK99_CUSEU|nr:unnamed protein product [Cuscuta europaea]
MATSVSFQPRLPARIQFRCHTPRQFIPVRHMTPVHAFRRRDFDMLAKRITSIDTWKDALRRANDGFENFVFETKKTAERIDRRYGLLQRLSAAAESTTYRAREIDREFEITSRWRTFTFDFRRNSPMYKKKLKDFLDTPLGKTLGTGFFIWFAVSGLLFRFLVFGTLVLPIAAPLLIGLVANTLVINGECPACRRQFIGYKTQTICCTSCGSIVWKPQGDLFSKGSQRTKSSKSQPDVIDVEFEEK